MRTLTTFALIAAILAAGRCHANPFDIAKATDLFVPTFRGDASTTYFGVDTFDDSGAGDLIVNDATPDIGGDAGLLVTTNGEQHISGSLNYYSSSGSVAEDASFATAGVNGDGFTTVVVQAKTLIGEFGTDFDFSPIDGVAPAQVLQATNAAGSGQLFAKYELPGTADAKTFSIATGPDSMISLDKFVIDTLWSPDGFAPDFAIATPEPSSVALGLVAAGVAFLPYRRRIRFGIRAKAWRS